MIKNSSLSKTGSLKSNFNSDFEGNTKTQSLDMVPSLSYRGRILFVISIFSFFLGFNINYELLWISASILILYLAFYILQARFSNLNDISVSISSNILGTTNSVRLGDLITFKVELKNKSESNLKIFYKLEIDGEYFIILNRNPIIKELLPKSIFVDSITILSTRRGQSNAPNLCFGFVDPLFCVFKQKKVSLIKKSIITILPVRPYITISKEKKKQVRDLVAGSYAYRRKGVGEEFFSIREYIQGDETRIIDWRSSARRNKLQSKEFEDELVFRLIIGIDNSHTMRHDKLEYVLSSTLEIIEMMSLNHDSTAIIVFNETVKRISKSSKTFNQAIKTLFNLNSEMNTKSNLNSIISVIKNMKGTPSILIIFSDSEGNIKEKIESLMALAKFGHKIIYVDLNTPKFNLFQSDGLILSSYLSKHQEFFDVTSSNTNLSYNTRQNALKDIVEDINGKYLLISSFKNNFLLMIEELLFPKFKRGENRFLRIKHTKD